MSTVRATREASEDELFYSAASRAKEALGYGITTLEVKSGYGLDLETELKMLRVVKRLGDKLPMEFVPTFLAHMVPADSGQGTGDGRKKYVQKITSEVLPVVTREKLAKFCDVFVENIAFTKKEAEEILTAAAKLGLKPKLHADQMTGNGGAGLAARLKAISADHLENISPKDIKTMAKAGTVAVLIPSSTFFIGGKYAPAREMIKAGVDVAVSTDYNPGTSPVLNLWLAATMAITQMKMTPEEAYKGITINAARALGLGSTHGSIEAGKAADLVILDTKNEFEPFYRFDNNFVSKVIKGGTAVA
jgi:imidazolonepropionase